MKRIILFLIYNLVFFGAIQAQQKIHISGKVLNDDTKEIIVHAYIRIGNQITVLSNHQGEFHLNDLQKGTLNLYISHVAYKAHKLSVYLSKDTVFNIYLTPKSIDLDEVNVHKAGPNNTANTLKIEQRKESQGKNLAD